MALYDTTRMAAALGGIPTHPSSAADAYRLSRPPSRGYGSYAQPGGGQGNYASRSSSPAPFACRAPSPARSSSVVYGGPTRSTTPALYGPAGSASRATSPARNKSRGGFHGDGTAGFARSQSFYPSPTEPSSTFPSLSYPCSGAGSPSTTSANSPFLSAAPTLDNLPPNLTLTLSQLGNSLEVLATDFPVHSPLIQHHRPFAEAFFSWIKLLLPLFSSITNALAQLRTVAEAVWRAAGGFVAASKPRPITVDVEAPDPEGGSHTVTGSERLAPLSATAIVQATTQIRQVAASCKEVGQAVEHRARRLSSEAERFVALLQPVEELKVQMTPRFPGGAVPRVPARQLVKTLLHSVTELLDPLRRFYQVLTNLSSDSAISSGVWYHPSEARDVFHAYRRVDSTLSNTLTQTSHAYGFTLDKLRSAGYLPPSPKPSPYGSKASEGDGRRAHTFPSLSPEKVLPMGYSRPSSAGGMRSSSPSLYSSGYGSMPGTAPFVGGAVGGRTRSRSRTR